MATIVTVHGTFAHSETEGTASTELQWWQPGSTFEKDVQALVEAAPGSDNQDLKVQPFVWSGENSERSRRAAGKELLGQLNDLEAKNEPYCVIGHSHGGSVVGWALLESGARKRELRGLKRWITVGTPFVSLRKERFLFQRIDLVQKVIFVASFMLLAMFLIDVAAQLFGSGTRWRQPSWLQHRGLQWLISAVLMSLPIIVFYFGLRYWNALSLIHYRKRVRERARSYFAQRWLPLTHTEDEAVQGLAFLPGAKLYFFDKSFAVSTITLLSVVAVPLIYLVLLKSPKTMVWLAGSIKDHFYTSLYPETEKILREARAARRAWRDQFPALSTGQAPRLNEALSQAQRTKLRETYTDALKKLDPNLPGRHAAERALRFKRTFFENRDGTPCNGGKLCGNGQSFTTNSKLLLYLVTNQVATAIAGDDSILSDRRSVLATVIPALLVPVVFGIIALGLMLLIRWLAGHISNGASIVLNKATNSEVKRAAFGNDTESEIAIGAVDRPMWIDTSPVRLPKGVADLVTDYSNGVASNSLAKFRQAIGQLASAEPKHTADSAITTYFTWKELVHASYFDVPEFRKLVAQAVTGVEGFAPSERFKSDADYTRTAQWLAEVEGTPGSPEGPGAKPPKAADSAAVSAVLASTVKLDP